MVHVPYRGTGPALADILAGNVDLFFDNLGSSMPMHRGGKAKILAVATPERSKLLPEIPTLREAGLRDFSSSTWFAMVAPPGTPAAIAEQVNKAVNDVLAMPESRRSSRRWACSRAWSRRRSLRRLSQAKRRAGPTSPAPPRSRRNNVICHSGACRRHEPRIQGHGVSRSRIPSLRPLAGPEDDVWRLLHHLEIVREVFRRIRAPQVERVPPADGRRPSSPASTGM